MALLALVANDTEENRRSKYTHACLRGLSETVNWSLHRLTCVDNASCDETKGIFQNWLKRIPGMQLITNPANEGQARATNQAWCNRRWNENVARLDNDILIATPGWLDTMEEAIGQDPKLGIIGGKRSDIPDSPNQPDGCWSRTTLKMLHHAKGDRWIVVEPKYHILGACQMTSAALIEKVGYLYQGPHKWGGEDIDMACRCELAGFYSAYLPEVTVKHMDSCDTPYQAHKDKEGHEVLKWVDGVVAEYRSGSCQLWREPLE